MERKIEKILLVMILIGAVFSISMKDYINFLSYLVILSFSLFFLNIINKLGLSKNYRVIVLIMMWLHIFGRYVSLYNTTYYDKVLHLISPFLITMIVYDYFKRFKLEYPKTTVFLLVLGMLCSFEIYEFLLSSLVGIQMQGVFDNSGAEIMSPIVDTMIDLILGAMASMSFLFLKKETKK